MKKIILLISISWLYLSLWSNPCIAPDLFRISELYFDNTNKWFIELDKYYMNEYDSIIVSSSTEKSKAKNVIFNYNLVTITTDSLISNVNINPLGDSITVTIYSKSIYFGNHLTDVLVFGNYQNAVIGKPKSGHSIAICNDGLHFDCDGRIYNNPKYNFDMSPSIGASDDCNGMFGYLQGFIYDYNNQPSANSTFKIVDEFDTNAAGGYSAKVYARPNKIDSIWKIVSSIPQNNGYYELSMPIEFTMVPDSFINTNIYLSNVWVAVQDIKINSLIKLYPNPVNQNSILNYEIALPVKSSNCFIEIMDANGRCISSQKISDSEGTIHLPKQLHQGVFLVNFKVNNKVYKASRIIISNK